MEWKSVSGRYLRTLMIRFEAGPERVKVNGMWVPWPRCPEGGALKAYQCSANKWTIAFGCTRHPDGRRVQEGDTITPDQVWEYTDAAVARVEADIASVVTIDLEPHQYAGIVFWVYNLGITALKNTVDGESKLLPKINAGRWLDAATAMGVFVYTTTAKDGKPWKRAMFGLFIRRCAEGCLLMGCDWEYACDPDRLSLPTRTDWQDRVGRFYDVVLDGKTPFVNVLRDARSYPLSEPADAILFEPAPTPAVVPKVAVAPVPDSAIAIPEDVLVLDTPAAPATGPAAGQPGAAHPTQPSPPAAPAPTIPAATGSGHAGPATAPKPAPVEAPSPTHPGNAPVPKVTFPKEPEKPKAAPVPAPPLPKDAAPASIEPKDLVLSKRFWGLFITGVGTTNFLPRAVQEWASNEGNRELLTMLIVVVVGFVLYKIGQRTAKRPLK